MDSFTNLQWNGSAPANYEYVDLFELLTRQWDAIRSVDIVEQVDAAGLTPLRAKQVRELSYVVGREYQGIAIAELERTAAAGGVDPEHLFRPDVVPYFEVEAAGRKYRSDELSRGELSALTLHWVLQGSDRDTLLLLDEPDLMMSPISARRALDLIVDSANTKKTPVVIATHSYLGLAEAPRSTQVLLQMASDGRSALANPYDYSLWEVLRVAAPTRLILVVEDRMAQLILSIFLDAAEFPHVEETEIWIGGDAAKVALVGKLPDFDEASVLMWGVLDGNEELPSGAQKLLVLPGGDSPEEGVLRICASTPQLVANGVEKIGRALDRTVGMDAHDRVIQVAHALGLETEEFVSRAWRGWIERTDEGRAALVQFQQALRQVVEALEAL
ncbi:hypothetical protein NY057_14250 [Curtobacterium flaccumfaciens]|uniref:hypothetical protein n=1 Tax=Curtobacterium flaccumfaciens TaxID=2035 RepID=UPI0021FD5923|nr:hypothetical protein [Curtobacterium flaccumfaciens]UWD81959.1 hypothetical protein NY057_14250 [Curtobacterium flaccumfaciens]